MEREHAKLLGMKSLLRAFSPGESVSVWEKDNEGRLVDVTPGVVMKLTRKGDKGSLHL